MPKTKIFLSYRRADKTVQAVVGRVYDRLSRRMGAEAVFLDEEIIQPGEQFAETTRDRVRSSRALLLFMGPDWRKQLTERSDSSFDYVVDEVRTALQSGVRVVPILVGDAELPTEEELPEDLKQLPHLHAHRLGLGRDFNSQMADLVGSLESRFRARRRILMGGSAVAAAAIGATFGAPYVARRLNVLRGQTLNFLLVMGEDVFYEREIASGFRDGISSLLEARGAHAQFRDRVAPRFEETYASPDTEQGGRAWGDVIERIRGTYSLGDIDYFVCMGTYASQAIKRSGLVEEVGARGIIYLGVTDPASAGLRGLPNVAGVQYGPGGYAYGQKISEVFDPQQKLVFVYQDMVGNVQDVSVRTHLESLNREYANTPGFRTPRFEFEAVVGEIDFSHFRLSDHQDPISSDVYFAWYGLDNILAQTNAPVLKEPSLWIVPSTYSEANLSLAGVIVSVEDSMVGRLGAELTVQHALDPTVPLESLPTASPPFKVWVNRKRVEEKGIVISETIYSQTDKDRYEIS